MPASSQQPFAPRVVIFADPNGAGKSRRVSLGGHDVPADVVRRHFDGRPNKPSAWPMPLASTAQELAFLSERGSSF